MNRQQRRQRERENRKRNKDILPVSLNKPKITQTEYRQVMNTLNAVKMASLLVLRDQGWGKVRIQRFSERFNEVLLNVSQGWLSLSDISDMLEDEIGLGLDELKVE